jgi:hypothetical protein
MKSKIQRRHLFADLTMNELWITPFKGTVARDFLARVFFMDQYSIWASDFEAKRIFFSFSFSRNYSNFSMNPRSSLLQGNSIDIRSSSSRHK